MVEEDYTIIIIDDDKRINEDALVDELKEEFNKVLIFNEPEEGIEHIKNIERYNVIILLDLAFSARQPNGHKILEEIRRFSLLIPIIIWTAGEEVKPISDLFENKIFAYIEKTESSEVTINKIKDAILSQQSSIQHALEEWIVSHPDDEFDKPYIIDVEGKQYSLSDILHEIRLETEIGRSFTKRISKLTIDLLSRNKESFND